MSIEELLAACDRLIERAEAVDHHIPEDSALLGLAQDLAPRVTGLLREGVALLDRVAASPELGEEPRSGSDSTSLSLQDIGVLISAEIADREIADLAYYRHELRECLRQAPRCRRSAQPRAARRSLREEPLAPPAGAGVRRIGAGGIRRSGSHRAGW